MRVLAPRPLSQVATSMRAVIRQPKGACAAANLWRRAGDYWSNSIGLSHFSCLHAISPDAWRGFEVLCKSQSNMQQRPSKTGFTQSLNSFCNQPSTSICSKPASHPDCQPLWLAGCCSLRSDPAPAAREQRLASRVKRRSRARAAVHCGQG